MLKVYKSGDTLPGEHPSNRPWAGRQPLSLPYDILNHGGASVPCGTSSPEWGWNCSILPLLEIYVVWNTGGNLILGGPSSINIKPINV